LLCTLFAEKHNAILLSSDKVVSNTAKKRLIDYHGMLWIFDRLVAAEIQKKYSPHRFINALSLVYA
jgi:hypothetical protein